MSEVIVAYQPSNTIFLFRQVKVWLFGPPTTWAYYGGLSIDDLISKRNIAAKWTIRLKGGIPKLDTPILSEEDVKDLND